MCSSEATNKFFIELLTSSNKSDDLGNGLFVVRPNESVERGGVSPFLRVQNAIIDWEIVYLGASGKPQFYSLLRRRSPQHFVAFDSLWLDGKDLRALPLLERKRILRTVVPAGSPVLYADYIEHSGTELYRAVCDMDLEGVVAKRKDGLYTLEQTTWLKIKNPRHSQMDGRRELYEKRSTAAVGTQKHRHHE